MAGSNPARNGIVSGNGTPSSLSNDEFLRWSSNSGNGFPDAANAFNRGAFGANALASPSQSLSIPSNQLTRRPVSRQLMASRPSYDFDGSWSSLGDDAILDHDALEPVDEADNIDLLEERASVAKREALAKRKQIPPFVQKLSSFLDESKNTELIRWSDKGDSFIVLDEDEFAKTLIPELFKHNNYASFVRQLNMYGFHKRVGLSDNSMKASERKNKSPSEYSNPYFRRGHPNLLWLINKPKGGAQKKNKGTRAKAEDGVEVDSDEDVRDVDESTATGSVPKTITSSDDSKALQRREMSVVRQQLQDIQKQQHAISSAIARLRKDHNQLYQQAVAFQTLHDRHENSINAILSFLATIYNRSLDSGQGAPNLSQMFANAIPQDQRGDIVDMGDISSPQVNPGGVSPVRRQRLLMAPPGMSASKANSPASRVSPMSRSASFQSRQSQQGHVEELDNQPSESPKPKVENDAASPQQDILNIINNTNAQNNFSSFKNGMPVELPDVLSQYDNASGKSPPLTSEQRNSMLSLIANSSSPPGSNNALVSPTPPPMPDLQGLAYTQSEIDELVRMQREQSAKLDEVSQMIQPLSPSGSIPGLTGDQYFAAATGASPGGPGGATPPNLDLDQYLDMGAYGGQDDGTGGIDFSTPQYNDSMFDFSGLDKMGDEDPGQSNGLHATSGAVNSISSSNANSPDMDRVGGDDGNAPRSPLKRRRKE